MSNPTRNHLIILSVLLLQLYRIYCHIIFRFIHLIISFYRNDKMNKSKWEKVKKEV